MACHFYVESSTLTFHLRMQPIGRTMPFTSKDEPIAVGVFNIPVHDSRVWSKPKPFWAAGLSSKASQFSWWWTSTTSSSPSTSPKMFIRNREAKWMNQMQAALGDRTKTTDVTRILGDFRIKKDDVKHALVNECEVPFGAAPMPRAQAVEQTYEDS